MAEHQANRGPLPVSSSTSITSSSCVEVQLVQRLILAETSSFGILLHQAYDDLRLHGHNQCPLEAASCFDGSSSLSSSRESTTSSFAASTLHILQDAKLKAQSFLSLPSLVSLEGPTARDDFVAESNLGRLRQLLSGLQECVVLPRSVPLGAVGDPGEACRLWLCLVAVSADPVLRIYAMREIVKEVLDGYSTPQDATSKTPSGPIEAVAERAHRMLFTLTFLASSVVRHSGMANVVVAALYLIDHLPSTASSLVVGVGGPGRGGCGSSAHSTNQLLVVGGIHVLRALLARRRGEGGSGNEVSSPMSGGRIGGDISAALHALMLIGGKGTQQQQHRDRADSVRHRLVSAIACTVVAAAGGAEECCAGSSLSSPDPCDGGRDATQFLLEIACAVDVSTLASAGEVAKLALNAAVCAFCPSALAAATRPVGQTRSAAADVPPVAAASQRAAVFLTNVLKNLVAAVPELLPAVHKFLAKHSNNIVTSANKALELVSGKQTTTITKKPPSSFVGATVEAIIRAIQGCIELDVAVLFDPSSAQSIPLQTMAIAWRSFSVWASKGDPKVVGLIILALTRAIMVPTGRCGELVLTSKVIADQPPKVLFQEVAMCLRDVTSHLDQKKATGTAETATGTSSLSASDLEELAIVVSIFDLGKDATLIRLAQAIRTAYRISKIPQDVLTKAIAARWVLHDIIGTIPPSQEGSTEVPQRCNLWIELLARALVVPGGQQLPYVASTASKKDGEIMASSRMDRPPPGTLQCWRLAKLILKHMNGALTLSSQRSTLLSDVIPHLPALPSGSLSQNLAEARVEPDEVLEAREVMLLLCSKFGLFTTAPFAKCLIFVGKQIASWLGTAHAAFAAQLVEKIKSNVITQLPKDERRSLEQVPVEWLRKAVLASIGALQKDLVVQEKQFKQFELEEKQYYAEIEQAEKQAVEDVKKGQAVREKELERERVRKEKAAVNAPVETSVFKQVQRLASGTSSNRAGPATHHTVVDSQEELDVINDEGCMIVPPPAKKHRTEEQQEHVVPNRNTSKRGDDDVPLIDLSRKFVMAPEPKFNAAAAAQAQREIDNLRRTSDNALRSARLKKASDDLIAMLRSAVVETVVPPKDQDGRDDVNLSDIVPAGGVAALASVPTEFDEHDEQLYASKFIPLLAIELRHELVSCASDLAKKKPQRAGILDNNEKMREVARLGEYVLHALIPMKSADRPWPLQDSTHVQLKIQSQSDELGHGGGVGSCVSKDDAVLIVFFPDEEGRRDESGRGGDGGTSPNQKFSEHTFFGIVDAVAGQFATIYVRNTKARPFVPMLSSCNNLFSLMRLTNLASWYLLGSSLMTSCLSPVFWPILCHPQHEAARIEETVKNIIIPSALDNRVEYNEFQKKAIALATTPRIPLVIIDGPPGTGKTHTIHGILSELFISSPSTSRILVCAPSNVAVDEILLRVYRRGVVGRDGRRTVPQMLRVGMLEGVDKEVRAKRLFIDDIITDAKNSANGGINNSTTAREALMMSATIVFTTLGSLRHIRNIPFETVIIDEAAQAIEPQVVVAMTSKNCSKVILVGDPNQLQAVLISQIASKKLLGRSLIQRLLIHDYPSTRLCLQYRMHPAISCFPNDEFYEGSLIDAACTTERPRRTMGSLSIPSSMIGNSGELLVPRMVFLDVADGRMERRNFSYVNPREADVLVQRMREFRVKLEATVPENCRRVGILTFYKAQVWEIYNRLTEAEKALVHVSTVDGFQGKEKDIIFISCVRSGDPLLSRGEIGFLVDRNRTNVALTRAKEFLFVVGNASTLTMGQSRGTAWDRLVAFSRQSELASSCRDDVAFVTVEAKTSQPGQGVALQQPKRAPQSSQTTVPKL